MTRFYMTSLLVFAALFPTLVVLTSAECTSSNTVNSKEVVTYAHPQYDTLFETLSLGDKAENVVYSVRKDESLVSSVQWNLPVGKAMVLLMEDLGSTKMDSEVVTQRRFDLIGTGEKECSDNTILGRQNMNDNVNAYYWSSYDVDIGYAVLLTDPNRSGNNWGGSRRTLFLSDFTQHRVISMEGWEIDSLTSGILVLGSLGKDIQIQFWENYDGSGTTFIIEGWDENLQNFDYFVDAEKNDMISSFRWSKRETLPLTADLCEWNTETLMTQIHSEYNDAEVTETLVQSTGGIFVDFSTNSGYNAIYAKACHEYKNLEGDAVGGNYQELHYEAVCSNTNLGIVEEHIVVSGHPRCYALECGDEDQSALLEDFAIQLMENRANDDEPGWTCTGKESDVHFAGLCDYETESLSSATNLMVAQDILNPSVESEKLFGFIPFNLDAQIVIFPENPQSLIEHETACLAGGGIQKEKNIRALCTDETGEAVDVPYRIEKYPVCLAQSCSSGNLVDENAAALTSFVEFMKLKEQFGTTVFCEDSGAVVGAISMGAVAVLTMLVFSGTMW